jgi:hypothetical protein
MKAQNRILFALLAILLVISCTRDIQSPDAEQATSEIKEWKPSDGLQPYIPKEYLKNIRAEDLAFIENELLGQNSLEQRRSERRIPNGSMNALAAAIEAAQYGEVIVLEPGDHYQTGTLNISKVVHIEGCAANLIFSNTPYQSNSNFAPAIHYKKGSAISSLRGITIKSLDSIPGLAIFIDRVDQIKILDVTLENWHSSIVAYDADYTTIWKNKVHCNRRWQVGKLGESFGIVFSDGRQNLIINNEVDGGLFGIWTGGAQGTDFHNSTWECLYGQILCKVPAGALTAGGTVVNTVNSSSDWSVNFNSSRNNFAAGFLVIDGATHNFMEHNKTSGNLVYDFELTGITSRFGFESPSSFNNRLYAYPGQKVKDCGTANQIFGGQLVNNALDPCN